MSAIVGSTSIVCSGRSLTRPRRCPGAFRKKGTGAMSWMLPAAHEAPVVAEPEAHTVIGHHGDDGAVVDADLVQAVEQLAEQPVGRLDLEQMALVGLLDDELGCRSRAARPSRGAPPSASGDTACPEGRY